MAKNSIIMLVNTAGQLNVVGQPIKAAGYFGYARGIHTVAWVLIISSAEFIYKQVWQQIQQKMIGFLFRYSDKIHMFSIRQILIILLA